ncbi:FAD/NAD(P)-binding domain-containing protein, partial [Caulochytrium protostelioides]
PWPTYPRVMRQDYGHQEAAVHCAPYRDPRSFSILSKGFISNGAGAVKGIATVRVAWTRAESGAWAMAEVPGSEEVVPADLVLLALGFCGPEAGLAEQLGVPLDARGNYATAAISYATAVPGVYAAGDCRRGQSLVVWGITEGRQAARQIDMALMASSRLP